ncbi:hypothetical protein M758_4G017400 [Ceratodon purpureus]|nr:hypothetical protein M758_4G017400 [Ceratodon purpureus]
MSGQHSTISSNLIVADHALATRSHTPLKTLMAKCKTLLIELFPDENKVGKHHAADMLHLNKITATSQAHNELLRSSTSNLTYNLSPQNFSRRSHTLSPHCQQKQKRNATKST